MKSYKKRQIFAATCNALRYVINGLEVVLGYDELLNVFIYLISQMRGPENRKIDHFQ